ncbi:MAG: hypothetical protein ACI841_004339, partial [Planctomycetota bacterium]
MVMDTAPRVAIARKIDGSRSNKLVFGLKRARPTPESRPSFSRLMYDLGFSCTITHAPN